MVGMTWGRCLGLCTLALVAFSATLLAAASPQLPLDVPFRLVGNSAPIVIVRIQDRDISLYLDIGSATPLVLQPALLAQLKTTPTGESFSGFGMEGKVFTAPLVTLDRVDMGGAVFSNVSVRRDEHDGSYQDKQLAEAGTQGSIGTELFKNYQLVLDYARHRMTLVVPGAPLSSSRHCRGQIIPLVRDGNHWGLVSRVSTETGERLFVWDTGSPAFVMPKASAIAAHLDTSQDAVTLQHFRMNGHEFGPLRFEIWDFPAPAGMAGFIGRDFFAAHVVCIDFPGNRLFVR